MTAARTVHFVVTGSAYLPELMAYQAFLAERGIGVQVHRDPAQVPQDARVVWWICGRVDPHHTQRLRHALHVHEYASASIPPAAWLKDRVKRWTQPVPQHRVFQNEWVRARMGFGDGAPHSLRDMGVPASFFTAQPAQAPDRDLVYVGATSRLASFLGPLQALGEAGGRLRVVGQVDEALAERLRSALDVDITGTVAQDEVPQLALRARAGLNLMPLKAPFIHQTSTKVLEYLALGLPVVSNAYPWLRSLRARVPGRIIELQAMDKAAWQSTLDQLPQRLSDRSDLSDWAWSQRLQGLPVWDAVARALESRA